jgi:hypothetical protein
LTISPSAVRTGARKPRVCNYPLYVSSAGQEAIDLAAEAGLVMDPWQADILIPALGERPDGRWSAFEVACLVSRQNGKGALLEARVLAGLLLYGERLIMWTAHELKTAMEAFRRVESLFENCDDLRRRVKKVSHANGDEGIELRSGHRLRFVARSKGSGRGFSGDLVILDEAYALTPEQVEALMPTMSARPNPQIWYTSSPPLDAATGAQLFSVRKRGLDSGAGLAYFDFGAEGNLGDLSSVGLDDPNVWAATNPAFGIRVSEEFIGRERAAMSDEGFARERLGIWPLMSSDGWQVIKLAAWAALADPLSSAVDPLVFAADVTPDRGHASIGMAGLRADGRMHVEVIDNQPGTAWVVPRVLELVGKWKPCAVVVDAAGPAGSLIAPLGAAGVEVLTPSAREAAQACGQFYDAVVKAPDAENFVPLAHRDNAVLNAALGGAQTRPLGDAWAWARKGPSVDISPLVAVTLAAWGHSVKGHIVDEQVEALVEWR